MKKTALITFSGGETSAFMTQWLLENKSDEYNFVLVFANTGQENEQTLEFAHKCEVHFGWDLKWVEAKVIHGKRKASTFKLTNFQDASRNGEPFEEVIKKYGIPDKNYPHCTRELKENPIHSYMRHLGFKPNEYYTCIGIRVDEIDRVNPRRKEKKILYPLVDMIPTTKPAINRYWRSQPFRLELKGYQGNCKWCWKKSLRKHLTLMRENPEYYDFPEEMEQKYGNYSPPNRNQIDVNFPLRFFRKGMSVQDIRELSKQDFEPAKDDSVIYTEYTQTSLFGYDLDSSNGCSESCEVFTE